MIIVIIIMTFNVFEIFRKPQHKSIISVEREREREGGGEREREREGGRERGDKEYQRDNTV